MRNAVNEPQVIIVFGGTSEIGLAVVRAVLAPTTTAVVLACRDLEAGERAGTGLHHADLTVDVVGYEAGDAAAADRVVADAVRRHGDVDLAVVAVGQLGRPDVTVEEPTAAFELLAVNTAGAAAAVLAAGRRMRAQGHGAIVVLSSVAGERVRRANPVYGASKAGLDGFARGYGDLVAAEGVQVLVVRPGFVHTRMTTGLRPAPLSTTPEDVAEVVARGLATRRRVVWAPGPLRWLFVVLRHLPAGVWRRLPDR